MLSSLVCPSSNCITREEELAAPQGGISEPIADRCSGLFGDFKLGQPSRSPLDHRGAVSYLAADAHAVDAQPHEVTAPQLAVDRKIEQSEVAAVQVEAGRGLPRPSLVSADASGQ